MAQFSRYSTYIEPFLKKPQNQAYGIMILSLFAIVFFAIFAIRPTILTIIALQSEIKQDNELDQKLSQKLVQLGIAQNLLDEYGPRQSLLLEALPQNPNITSLMSIIERRAQEAKVSLGNVQVRSVSLSGEESRTNASQSATLAAETDISSDSQTASPSGQTAPLGLSEIRFIFTATGSFDSIVDFIHRLAVTRRIITVDGVHVVSKEGSPTMTAEISAKSYQLTR